MNNFNNKNDSNNDKTTTKMKKEKMNIFVEKDRKTELIYA